MTRNEMPVQRGIGIVAHGVWAADARRCASYCSFDAQGNQTLLITHRDDAVIAMPDTSAPGGSDTDGSLDVVAEASWPTTTTVRLTVDTQLQATYGTLRVFVEAVGGTDITNAKVGDITEPGSTGTQNVTDPGFQPTGMEIFGVGWSGTINTDVATQGMFTLGRTDGTRSWVAFTGADDNSANGSAQSYCKSGEIIAMTPDGGVAFDGRASVTGFQANGIDLNWSEATAGARKLFYLAWAGGQYRVDSVTTATNTTPFNGPTAGFTPSLAGFVSCGRAESTADTPTTNGMISFGAAVSATDRFSSAVQDVNGAATMNCGSAAEFDEVYISLDTSDPPVVVGLMDVNTWADPLSLVMDDADPSGSFVGVDLIGAAATGLTPNLPAGSLAVAGLAAALAFSILPGVGSAPATGYAPTVFEAHTKALPAAAVAVQGYAPALGASIALQAGQLPIAGQAPTVAVQGMVIQVPAGSLSVAGQYVTVAFMDPAPGALVITGQAPTLGLGVALPAGSAPVTGYAPQIVGAGALTPGVGALTATGHAPVLGLGVSLPVGGATVTGQVLSVSVAVFVAVPAGSTPVTGYAASLNGASVISPASGSLPCAGYAPALALTLPMGAGQAQASGYAAAVPERWVPVGALQVAGYALTVSSVSPSPAVPREFFSVRTVDRFFRT